MKLSIITINRNNDAGLEKTLKSVGEQTRNDFEHIIIDGGSTDGSVGIIQRYAELYGERIKWISEADNGIYNAMNKGIRIATGEYLQFLNSGDCLAAEDVTNRMLVALESGDNPSILYGNMAKCYSDGRRIIDKSFQGREITMLDMYIGTLNHPPAYICRELFDKYGLYDESLKVVSDWKWYIQAIVFGREKPQYADIDVTLFDMGGVSETNMELVKQERKQVLDESLPEAILNDYKRYSFAMKQFERLQCHPWAYKLVWFLERCLFRIDKYTRK